MWIYAVAVVAFALASAVGTWRRAQRRQDIRAVARRAGLQYSQEDPFDCTRVGFGLFRKGDGRGAENVLWRDAPDGHTYRAFDYWYYDQDSEGHKTYHRSSCAMALVGSSWPDISITREGLLSKVAGAVAGGDIDFESEEFNRLFVVRCHDRRFATALLDARLIELLVGTRGELSFEIKGRWLLVSAPPVKPSLVPGLIGVAEAFVEAIPKVVWELYPSTFVDEKGQPLPPGDDPISRMETEVALAELHDEDDPFAVLETSPFEALERKDGVEYDLDGNVVPKHEERPWG
jgi:hypothetical protein